MRKDVAMLLGTDRRVPRNFTCGRAGMSTVAPGPTAVKLKPTL